MKMQFEDAQNLSDALWIPVGPVIAGDDQFTFRPLDVAAPIRHNAIGALWFGAAEIAALAAISHDRVVGNALHGRDGIDGEQEAVVRVKPVQAAG